MKSRRSMFRAMDWGQVCVKYSVVYTCQRRYPLFMKQKHSNGEKRFNLQSSMSIRIWLSLRQWLRDKIFSTIKVIPSPVSVCKNCKKMPSFEADFEISVLFLMLFMLNTMGLIKDMWTIENTFCFIIIVTTPAVAAASEADGQITLSAGVRQC